MRRTTFEGEELVTSWEGITLTTHRVMLIQTHSNVTTAQTLMLSQVDHTSLRRSHQPALLVGAAVAGIAATLVPFATSIPLAVLFFALLALALALAWWRSRRVELTIGAGTGAIRVHVVGGAAGQAQALSFLDAVDRAAAHP